MVKPDLKVNSHFEDCSMAVKLSVNVNKAGVLRNSRGGNKPCLIQMVEDLIQFGVWGITVHPRPDGRHILYQDVQDIAQCVQKHSPVEFNVEGYPSEKFLDLIQKTRPHQCTLVPDPPEALTSDQGWDLKKHFSVVEKVLFFLKNLNIRSSIFIDPLCVDLNCLQGLKPDRVEFYTGKWAQAFDCAGQKEPSLLEGQMEDRLFSEGCLEILRVYRGLSEKIHKIGIGINAGHDLNQKNLKKLLKAVPLIQEVSVGHAFICESLYDGLECTLDRYHRLLK